MKPTIIPNAETIRLNESLLELASVIVLKKVLPVFEEKISPEMAVI